MEKTWKSFPQQDRWNIWNLALSNTKGEADFFTNGPQGSAFDGLTDNKRKESNQSAQRLSIVTETLDNFVASNQVNRIDLIKIDVEGFEAEVLSGAMESIAQFKPMICLEWTLANRKGKETVLLIQIATRLNMEVYAVPSLTRVASESECALRALYREFYAPPHFLSSNP